MFALCCDSNATCALIANPPNSAQLGGIRYHSPKLHPGPCWTCGRGQTDRHTRVTTMHFTSSTTHAKCNNSICNASCMKDRRNDSALCDSHMASNKLSTNMTNFSMLIQNLFILPQVHAAVRALDPGSVVHNTRLHSCAVPTALAMAPLSPRNKEGGRARASNTADHPPIRIGIICGNLALQRQKSTTAMSDNTSAHSGR